MVLSRPFSQKFTEYQNNVVTSDEFPGIVVVMLAVARAPNALLASHFTIFLLSGVLSRVKEFTRDPLGLSATTHFLGLQHVTREQPLQLILLFRTLFIMTLSAVNRQGRPELRIDQPALNSRAKQAYTVAKFGGTSMAKFLPTIVDNIIPSFGTSIPILVCSALSYTVKAEGTTNCLFSAIDVVLKNVDDLGSPTQTVLEATDQRDARLDIIKEENELPVAQLRAIQISDSQVPLSSAATRSNSSAGSDTASGQLYSPFSDQWDVSSSQTSASLQADDAGYRMTQAAKIIEGILLRHKSFARKTLQLDGSSEVLDSTATKIFGTLVTELEADCDRIIRTLNAVSVLDEISPRTRDTIISAGELMSCRIAVAALRNKGKNAHLVQMSDIVPSNETSRSEMHPGFDPSFWDNVVNAMWERLQSFSPPLSDASSNDTVLVVPGFFGLLPGSILTHIGRGYTDVCAALCARAANAIELQIWKEVDGVLTADPKKIANASLLPEISRTQAQLLTSYGSEVVHPLAIDQASRSNIPIVIKNVACKNPARVDAGTRVLPTPSVSRTERAKSYMNSTPTFAVTVLSHLELVHVYFDDWELSPGRAVGVVMELIKEHTGVANVCGIDLVESSQRDVTFMISTEKIEDAGSASILSRLFEALDQVCHVTRTSNLAYLQIVYMTPHRPATVAGAVFSALSREGIDTKMIMHGPMEHGLGCVVEESVAGQAGEIVHDALQNIVL